MVDRFAGIFAHDYYDVTLAASCCPVRAAPRQTSSHSGNDAALDVGISRPYIAGGWQVTPRLGLSYFHIGQSNFSESGAGSLDLAVTPNNYNTLFSTIGVSISEPMRPGDTDGHPSRGAS